jgi:uncharacterized membrane protein
MASSTELLDFLTSETKYMFVFQGPDGMYKSVETISPRPYQATGEEIFVFERESTDSITSEYSTLERRLTSLKLENNLVDLFRAVLKYENDSVSTNRDTSMNELYEYVSNRSDLINFTSQLAEELTDGDKRDEFDKDKNRLITLMAKNKNIYNKLNSRKIFFYMFLALLVIYTIGLFFIYFNSSVDTQTQPIILIGLAITVIIVFVMIDIYQMLTKKHYEPYVDPELVTIDLLKQNISEYILQLPMMLKYNEEILKNKSINNSNKAEVIDSILHDFNNMNFVNMRRYQLTDYKINETRSNTHFIKYAFLIVSVIALMGGLHLRTDTLPAGAQNYLPVSSKMFTGVSIVLFIGFFTMLLLHQKQNKIRRKYNWNKLYWNVKATHENKYIV